MQLRRAVATAVAAAAIVTTAPTVAQAAPAAPATIIAVNQHVYANRANRASVSFRNTPDGWIYRMNAGQDFYLHGKHRYVFVPRGCLVQSSVIRPFLGETTTWWAKNRPGYWTSFRFTNRPQSFYITCNRAWGAPKDL